MLSFFDFHSISKLQSKNRQYFSLENSVVSLVRLLIYMSLFIFHSDRFYFDVYRHRFHV